MKNEVVKRAPRKRGPPPKEGSKRTLAALKRAEKAHPEPHGEQGPADDDDDADDADAPRASRSPSLSAQCLAPS